MPEELNRSRGRAEERTEGGTSPPVKWEVGASPKSSMWPIFQAGRLTHDRYGKFQATSKINLASLL